jgi:hypothetical protein
MSLLPYCKYRDVGKEEWIKDGMNIYVRVQRIHDSLGG